MNKEFVSYKLALELKELGFDEPCFGYRDCDWNFIFSHNKNKFLECELPLPLFQQIFRWFRENYNLHHEILLDQTTQPKYCFQIHKYEDFGNYEKMENKYWFLYRTYEEAETACIEKLIEIVKENKK